MDEYECPVILTQRRRCSKICFVFGCDKDCGKWKDVEVEKEVKGETRFPRFDTRAFDSACRVERMAKLAEAEGYHGAMVQAAGTVDMNVQSNFKGLNNFSPSSRRRRRLNGGDSVTSVKSFSVPKFRAVDAGSFGDTTFQAMYEGAELQKANTLVNQVNREFARTVNFEEFQQVPGQTPSGSSDIMSKQAKLGATDEYLGALKMDDPVWLAKQPIIEAPKLSILPGSLGATMSDPLVFDCVGELATAWMEKLRGSAPEAMRRRRSRRLQSGSMEETLVEITVVAIFTKM